MQSLKALLFLFLSDSVLSSSCPLELGFVKLPGECPLIKFLLDVDLNLVSGFYYGLVSSASFRDLGCNGDCVTLGIFKYNETSFRTESCCRKGCGSYCGVEVGSGVISNNPVSPGVIDYEVSGAILPTYIIGSDDFKTYIIVYGCFLGPDGSKQEIINVISRIPKLSEATWRQIKETFSQNSIDFDRLNFIGQYDACPYLN